MSMSLVLAIKCESQGTAEGSVTLINTKGKLTKQDTELMPLESDSDAQSTEDNDVLLTVTKMTVSWIKNT
jgi:hypothetical protein